MLSRECIRGKKVFLDITKHNKHDLEFLQQPKNTKVQYYWYELHWASLQHATSTYTVAFTKEIIPAFGISASPDPPWHFS